MNSVLNWVKSMELPTGGIRAWPGGKAYPEVSGYLIPTLLDYGERDLAWRLADWLLTIQNADGSFDGLDGVPRVFDTTACMEGLRASYKAFDEVDYLTACAKAGKWANEQGFPTGGLEISPGSNETREYTMRASGILGRKQDVTFWIKHGYYGLGTRFRSHYAAYYLEGLLMMGKADRVRHELDLALSSVQPNGLLPMWLKRGWVADEGEDACATAQIAILCLRTGISPSCSVLRKMIAGVRNMINADGGVMLHSLDNRPVSWAAKFYLDMEHLVRSTPLAVAVEINQEDYRIDYETWAKPKPFGFSGCFRLRNESQFMEAAILSHLPYLDEAVLIVQPSDDDTLAIAHRLADTYEKVNVFEYPYIPDWIDTPGFYSKDPDQPGHLVHMSNWAFTKCQYSWIVKVEGDVICLSSFEDIIYRVTANPYRDHYYGRVILNVAGPNCDQISQDNPRNGGWDEAVVPNNPAYHFERQSKWEVLQNPGPSTCMGWSGLHMKRCKRGKDAGWNGETYVPFERETVRETLRKFNEKNPYPGIDDPLGTECIYEWQTDRCKHRTRSLA